MIPKIIHYCWLSDDPIPEQFKMYMDTWKKYLPDYEFILWNFDRFPKEKSVWVQQAFDNKKYAFAADYIRLYALYNWGGIYLDLDVEVVKSFNPFLNAREMICRETTGVPEVAVLGVEKKCEWIKICLSRYENRHFIKEDGSFDMLPLPQVIASVLKENGYSFKDVSTFNPLRTTSENEIYILPSEYFSPKSFETGKIHRTSKTVSIHHFAGSWFSISNKLKYRVVRLIGPELTKLVGKIKRCLFIK